MKKNMGSTDRIIRILVAIIIATLYFSGVVVGMFGIILLIVAGIFLLTGFVSFCPIYPILGISTCPKKK